MVANLLPTITHVHIINLQSNLLYFQNMLLNADPNVLAHLQQLHRLLVRGSGGSGDTSAKSEGPPVHFDRKLLDFDYGEDEEEPQNPSPKITNSSAASAAHDSAVTR